MFKNTASKFYVFAFDSTTNLPKTGDAANITAYVAKDFGTATVLADTTATEVDSTNAKGYYVFDAAQAETNADELLISAKSSTSNIVVIGAPARIATLPTTGILAPATLGRTLVVDAAGLADANAVKLGPSGAGTALTAHDIGAGVVVPSNLKKNQAFTSYPIVMTDSTNHNPATGKAVSVLRSIDGEAFGAGTLGSVTELSNGVYEFAIGAGDLNGNAITFLCTATGCDNLLFTVITQP